jgi:hypothetical protein
MNNIAVVYNEKVSETSKQAAERWDFISFQSAETECSENS